MTAVVGMLTRLSALVPVLSSWESCALKLVDIERPSSISFFCKSEDQCPTTSFYNMVHTPMQTVFGLETHELPILSPSDLIFIVMNENCCLWGNETIQRYLRGGENSFKVVVVANRSENRSDNMFLMRNLFEATWASGVLNSVVLLTNATSSELFTYLPYREKKQCGDTTPVTIGQCSTVRDAVFDAPAKIRNLKGCPIRVSLIDDRPFARYPSTGRLINLINEISRRMNFTLEPITPDNGKPGGMCGPDEYKGSRGDVFSGRADMAVSSFNHEACSTLEYLGLPYTQCLAWCTPVMSGSDFIYLFIVQQLQPRVWFALIVTILIVVLSVYFICFVTRDKVSLRDALYFFVVVFAPVPIKASSNPVRLVLGLWILVCVVIRSAYEGELKSASAVPLGSRIIRSLEELDEEGIQLCSTLSSLQVLKRAEDPVIQTIFKKAEVCEGSLYENMVSASKLRDRAVFRSDLRCAVLASDINKESSTLYSNTGGCFMMYQFTLIVTMRGSPYKQRWKSLQQHCIEAGLVNKWLDLKPVHQSSGQVAAYSITHLLPALFILFVGWVSGFTTFVIENVFYKLYFDDDLHNQNTDYMNQSSDLILRKNTVPSTETLWAMSPENGFKIIE